MSTIKLTKCWLMIIFNLCSYRYSLRSLEGFPWSDRVQLSCLLSPATAWNVPPNPVPRKSQEKDWGGMFRLWREGEKIVLHEANFSTHGKPLRNLSYRIWFIQILLFIRMELQALLVWFLSKRWIQSCDSHFHCICNSSSEHTTKQNCFAAGI